MQKLIYILLLTAFTVGCSILNSDSNDSAERAENSFVTINPASLTISERQFASISYAIQNTTGNTIFFSTDIIRNTSPIVVEKRINGEWVFAFGSFVSLLDSPPLEIAPDSVLEQSFGFSTPSVLSIEQINEISGTYRLSILLFESFDEQRDTGDLIPKSRRVTESFELE
jgi:hypothetical protein